MAVEIDDEVSILFVVKKSNRGNPKFLATTRNSGKLAGVTTLIGGKIEMNESPEDCTRREASEESGLIIPKPAIFPINLEPTYVSFGDKRRLFYLFYCYYRVEYGIPRRTEKSKHTE